jgi:hypothetical protein
LEASKDVIEKVPVPGLVTNPQGTLFIPFER